MIRSQRSCILVLAVLIGLGLAAAVEAQEFAVGPVKARRGNTESGYLPVPEKDGLSTLIPVTVIRGSNPGKVLALVAGTHGAEYPPIHALYRLRDRIDPFRLSGTLILVHIANLPSFQKRTVYFNPFDFKNLNRVFPGDPNGTLSQRMAHVLTEEVVGKCDALIDMHCGDANEALIPYTYWMLGETKTMDDQTREMALAFGIPHIIIDTGRTKDVRDSKYLGNTAILRGKPAITTEAGYLGRSDEADILKNLYGAESVMRLFKMIDGTPVTAKDPVWIDKYEVVNSRFDGLFYPRVKMGAMVGEGEIVGAVRDYLGNLKEDMKAPFAGLILYILGTPPANTGEPLYEVGRVKK